MEQSSLKGTPIHHHLGSNLHLGSSTVPRYLRWIISASRHVPRVPGATQRHSAISSTSNTGGTQAHFLVELGSEPAGLQPHCHPGGTSMDQLMTPPITHPRSSLLTTFRTTQILSQNVQWSMKVSPLSPDLVKPNPPTAVVPCRPSVSESSRHAFCIKTS